jgi:hypothetical protein
MKLSVDNLLVRLVGEANPGDALPWMKVDISIRLPPSPITSLLPEHFERIVSQVEAGHIAALMLRTLAQMVLTRGGG